MYTASITETNTTGGNFQVVVSYTNGTDALVEAYNITSESDKDRLITNRLAQLNKVEELAATITPGQFTPAPITPAPAVEPTPEELAAQEASKARMEWHTKKAALATMIDDMDRGSKIGKTPSATQLAIMQGLADWIDANMKQEYYF